MPGRTIIYIYIYYNHNIISFIKKKNIKKTYENNE